MYRVYTLEVHDVLPPRVVVNLKAAAGLSRPDAIAYALADAARIGWASASVVRVSRTPSGGWSVTIQRA
jgi:hypothetical protein